jgi:hypothetical protein
MKNGPFLQQQLLKTLQPTSNQLQTQPQKSSRQQRLQTEEERQVAHPLSSNIKKIKF